MNEEEAKEVLERNHWCAVHDLRKKMRMKTQPSGFGDLIHLEEWYCEDCERAAVQGAVLRFEETRRVLFPVKFPKKG